MIDKSVSYVLRLDLRHCLLPSDFETIYNILFARRKVNETPSLRSLINTNAVTTRLKRTFKDSEDPKDDSMEEILIFWRFDYVKLPRIRSNIISIFDEKLDRHNFKLLNRSKYYFLLGTPKIHKLSVLEQYYLLHQLEQYLDRKPAKEVEICS